MIESLIQIKSGKTINIGVSAKIKKNSCVQKKIILGVLLHVSVKIDVSRSVK